MGRWPRRCVDVQLLPDLRYTTMTRATQLGLDLTEKQRAAAQREAARDSELSSIARLLVHLDSSATASSSEAVSSSSSSLIS